MFCEGGVKHTRRAEGTGAGAIVRQHEKGHSGRQKYLIGEGLPRTLSLRRLSCTRANLHQDTIFFRLPGALFYLGWAAMPAWKGLCAMACWLVAAAGAGDLRASEFQMQVGAYGLPGLQAGRSVGVLVADTADNGFAGVGIAAAGGPSVLAALPRNAGGRIGDDLVLMVLEATENEGVTALESVGAVAFDTGDPLWEGSLAAGQPLGLYYFVEGGSDPGFPYGFYRSDEVTDAGLGGDHPYRVPGPGASVIVLTVAETAGGSLPEETFSEFAGIVGEGGTTYEQWRDSVFGMESDMDEEDRSPRGDPDGDGQNNAAEYAAGSDPLLWSPPPLEVMRDEAGGWKLRYGQAADRTDALQYLEWSRDARLWVRADEAGTGEGPQFCFRSAVRAGGLDVEIAVDDGQAAGALFRLRVQVQVGFARSDRRDGS